MALQDWQARVVEEKTELDKKIVSLEAFLSDPDFYRRVPDEVDRSALRAQFGVMQAYSIILENRIRRF